MVTLDHYSQRANFPYLQGIYLAINALRDAVLVVDGPNCSFFKAEHVFGAHDMASTLLDVGGLHRVIHSDINVDAVITGHEPLLEARLREVARHERVGGLFLGALPMAALTGLDHRELAERIGDETGRQIFALPARSLRRDWLDGYADFLVTLAREIELPDPKPDPTKVAIVGNFMDRNEGDHRGNLSELRRLCESLGLELVSVWLGGQRVADLSRIKDAGLVVSLPHGREAARIVAERVGARLVVAPLPFGVDATCELVRRLGEASNRQEQATGAIDQGLGRVARAWEWLAPRRLLHRSLAFFGDPHLIPGLGELASLLGMRVTALTACSHPRELDEAGAAAPIVWEPKIDALGQLVAEVAPDTDLLVSNYWGLRWAGQRCPGLATLELGFPSRGYHRSREAPFLGYEGALELVDRLANALGDRCEYL